MSHEELIERVQTAEEELRFFGKKMLWLMAEIDWLDTFGCDTSEHQILLNNLIERSEMEVKNGEQLSNLITKISNGG